MLRNVALLATTALVMGACSGDDAASTTTIDTANPTGVWRTPDGFFLVMTNDGTHQSMSKPPAEDRSDEFEWGNYTITESTLVFIVADDAVLFTRCRESDANGDWVGIIGTYQTEAIGDDGQTWTTVLVDDACDPRARDYTGQFTRHDSSPPISGILHGMARPFTRCIGAVVGGSIDSGISHAS